MLGCLRLVGKSVLKIVGDCKAYFQKKKKKNLHEIGIERHSHVGLGRHQAIFWSDFKTGKLLRTS